MSWLVLVLEAEVLLLHLVLRLVLHLVLCLVLPLVLRFVDIVCFLVFLSQHILFFNSVPKGLCAIWLIRSYIFIKITYFVVLVGVSNLKMS